MDVHLKVYGLLAVTAAIGLFGIATTESPQPKHYCEKSNAEAIALSNIQQYAKSTLKSPRSARFGYMKLIKNGQCVWYTASYVDAQNGFGAMLRKEFAAAIMFDTEHQQWEMIGFEWR
ncbi:MAG: hypothetical protein GY807_06880 [Gammaproteobacteria bacterium]|nr:hypothetical protein [Gammaproteobacteria bacterium]